MTGETPGGKLLNRVFYSPKRLACGRSGILVPSRKIDPFLLCAIYGMKLISFVNRGFITDLLLHPGEFHVIMPPS
jgi:hypothetical protein